MKPLAIEQPLRIRDLSAAFQKFHKGCCEIGFGELRDCVFNGVNEICVRERRFTQAHPWRSNVVFDTEDLASEGLIRIYDFCLKHSRLELPVIQLKEGKPHFFQILEEGEWHIKEGA